MESVLERKIIIDDSKYKAWSIATLAIAVLFLAVPIVATYIFDPFFQYHAPFPGISYALSNESYHNPGIAKNFKYDTLITGTSMTQNFKASWFGEDAVKVPYSGGYSKNFNIILSIALENNPDLKRVYMGLDENMPKRDDFEATRNPLPMYLYDDNIFNDTDYVLNKSVFFNYVWPSFDNTKKNVPAVSFDNYSVWASSFKFSPHYLIIDFTPVTLEPLEKEHYKQTVKTHLELNILPIIEKYPDVKFTFFCPPYSVMEWRYSNDAGNPSRLDARIYALQYIAERFLEYDNVEYYLFNDERIVTNLYNYKDSAHYSQSVNQFMAECFASKKYLLTRENYLSELEKLKNIVQNFDYGLFDFKENPLLGETDIYEYLSKINNERYCVFVASRVTSEAKIPELLAEKFKELGLSPYLKDGWVGIASNGTAYFQATSIDDIDETVSAFGERIRLVSSLKDEKPFVGISMEDILPQNIEYANNLPGINLVVYDKNLKRVVDNVAFDPQKSFAAARKS